MLSLRSLAIAGTALTIAATTPATLHAQYCGGSSFKTCASVSITSQLFSQSGTTKVWQIVMNISNLSGTKKTYKPTIFTAIGLYGLGTYSYVSNSLLASGPGSWSLGTTGLSGSGITNRVAGIKANPSPIANGLKAGESASFSFRISGRNLAGPNTSKWAIHGQNGPLGCSTKIVDNGGVVNDGAYDPACGVDITTGTVTPEPASMILLGTGLFGVAGAAARRRKRIAA